MLKIKFVICLGIILFFSGLVFSQSENKVKCKTSKSIGGKYILFSETYLVENPNRVLLEIIIKPKNFNKEYMTKLANRIKLQYCNINTISVEIFDSKKSLLGWHYDFVTTGGKIDRRRGIYFLDKKTGEESLEFSTKSGNPINEITI